MPVQRYGGGYFNPTTEYETIVHGKRDPATGGGIGAGPGVTGVGSGNAGGNGGGSGGGVPFLQESMTAPVKLGEGAYNGLSGLPWGTIAKVGGNVLSGGIPLVAGLIGGGASGGNAPKMPDYMGAANAQGMANRPDINTPYGGQQWTHDANGNWTLNAGFNGALGGASQGLQNQWAQNVSQGLDNGSAARDLAISSAYGQASSRLDPMWNQRESQLQTRLANQGLDPTSEAATNASSQFGRDRNDAYTSAMASAIANGNQAQALTFNQNLAAREAPLHEMGQMQQLLNTPHFNTGPDYLGAAQAQGQYGLDATRLTNQAKGDMWGGIGQVAGGVSNSLGSLPWGSWFGG
jgi:hypothetical protein